MRLVQDAQNRRKVMGKKSALTIWAEVKARSEQREVTQETAPLKSEDSSGAVGDQPQGTGRVRKPTG